jgi:hypothetical protein
MQLAFNVKCSPSTSEPAADLYECENCLQTGPIMEAIHWYDNEISCPHCDAPASPTYSRRMSRWWNRWFAKEERKDPTPWWW